MRTRIGPAFSPSCAAAAADSAPSAVGKAAKIASPSGVDLDARLVGDGRAQDAPMLSQRARIAGVAELVQQPRRAFDIGEEEGDSAGRKITPPHRVRGYRLAKAIPQSHRRGGVDTGGSA